MSETNIFLVPIDEPGGPRRDLKARVLSYLTEVGIIDGFYDEDLGWYAAGAKSGQLFGGTAAQPAFEYAIIYDRQQAHFVPDSHTGGFGARCTTCEAGLDEAVYQMLEDQGEDEDAVDMAHASIRCSCGAELPLVSLRTEIDTAVSRFYLNFCHVDSLAVDPTILSKLAALVGAPLRLVGERL